MFRLSQKNASLSGSCPDSQAWESYLNFSGVAELTKHTCPLGFYDNTEPDIASSYLACDYSFLIIHHIVFFYFVFVII